MKREILMLGGALISACQCPGQFVEWDEAVELIKAGNVQAIGQAHSLDISLEMKDGCTLKTVEPMIDEAVRVLNECGDPCDETGFITE